MDSKNGSICLDPYTTVRMGGGRVFLDGG